MAARWSSKLILVATISNGRDSCRSGTAYVPHGVIPAVLLPFDNDLVDRRGELPQASARRRGGRGPVGASPSTRIRPKSPRAHSTSRRRVLDIAQDEIGGRLPLVQRHLGRRQPRGRAHRPHGGAGRRLGAAGVSAGAVHARPVAGDGARAFQAHRRCDRPAADRVPVSARDRAGLSEGHAAEDVRGGADRSAPSRTGSATCRITNGTSARCRACRGR